MRITIKQYAKWRKVTPQGISWKLQYNIRKGLPLHEGLPNITQVHKLGRSYELEFKGSIEKGKLVPKLESV